MTKLFRVLTFALTMPILPAKADTPAQTEAAARRPAQNLPQTVLTVPGKSTTRRFILPGATPVTLTVPDSVSKAEAEALRKSHAESFMSHPSLTMTEAQLPRPIRKRWRDCVRRTTQYGTSLNLEAVALLCAVSRDGRIQDLQYMVAPGRGQDSGSTIVVIASGADTATFEVLTGAVPPKSEALQAPVCPVGQFCNPCKLADPLNLGMVEVRLQTDDGEARGAVTADLIALIRDYASLIAQDSPPAHARVLDVGGQKIYLGHLAHALDPQRLREGRAKFMAAGTQIDPYAMSVLIDPRREDPTYNGFTLSPPVTLCQECPPGTRSNGVDDCLKDGKSVLYGTNATPEEFPCRGLTCWASCESSCANLESSVLPNLEEQLKRLPQDKKTSATLKLAEMKRRWTEEQNLCRTKREARVCVEAEYRQAHQMFSGTDLFQSEAFRYCEAGELEIPFPDGKPLNREQYLNCGPPKCLWGPHQFRYVGPRVVDGCPNTLVERMVRQIQTERWRSAKSAVCEENPITEAQVARRLRDLGVNCAAYRPQIP